MPTTSSITTGQDKPLDHAAEIADLIVTLRIAERSLNDASSVVDPGEGETYAYESELTRIRTTLARYPNIG